MKAEQLTSSKYPKRVALTALFSLFAMSGIIFAGHSFATPDVAASATPPVRAVKKKPVKTNVKPTPKASATPEKLGPIDFPHAKHQAKCDECHKFPSANWEKVRTKDAFPDIAEYPKHESCLKCHRDQFFSGPTPRICSICHTNPSPDDSSRYPFPNPRAIFDQSPKAPTHVSDFRVAFPHDKHIDVVSEYRSSHGAMLVSARYAGQSEASCKVCHETMKPQGKDVDEYLTKPPANLGEGYWIKKGTFKTSPVGHETCFTCHNADMGMEPLPNDCAACHKPRPNFAPGDFDAKLAASMGVTDKIMLDAWSLRESAGKFRHEFSSHADMACGDCHNAAKINLLDVSTTKVSITSCNFCHITDTTADGGALNYEIDMRKKDAKFECVKCHVTYGRSPIPESHLTAVGGK